MRPVGEGASRHQPKKADPLRFRRGPAQRRTEGFFGAQSLSTGDLPYIPPSSEEA
jgi:hypothetical protein